MVSREEGIKGWELANLDLALFRTETVQVFGGCKDCPNLDDCDTPCESIRRLKPKKGELFELSSEKNEIGDVTAYYALFVEETLKIIELREPMNCWASASYTTEERLPINALTELMKLRRGKNRVSSSKLN